jgi:class 3 adenylate cyclase/tetratricopeptide (TPR) repeat protein
VGNIEQWLEQHGLGKYAQVFAENEIELGDLAELTDDDLQGLGLPLGPRRRLYKALRTNELAVSAEDAPVSTPTGEAERRQLTVMFADLVGSTELSQTLDPEDLREVNRAYQDVAKGAIEKYDGFVARYMGDGVLAYFGFPQAHEDDAERAVRAGLELAGSVSRLEGFTKLAVRVGIATGTVVVGDTIGEGASQESAVVGETPNLAARLQGIAEPNTVVLSAATRDLVMGRFELEALGARPLKGIAEPVSAYRADEVREVSRFEAASERGLTPLVGRNEELSMLLRRWSLAMEGEGQVVLVGGEPGIGKSRMTDALRQQIQAEPHRQLRYQCSPYHLNSAFYPIIDHLERAAGFVSSDPDCAKLEKLEALPGLCEKVLTVETALLASLLSLPIDRYPALEMTPQRQRTETIAVLLKQVEALARSAPVFMVFEDIHWLDPSTHELLDATVDQVSGLPVLVVLTHRPDFNPSWLDHRHVTQLSLSRLGRRDSQAMVARVAGARVLPEAVLEQIAEKTDGIPLFVEEVAKTLLESQHPPSGREAEMRREPSSTWVIPASLHDSLMARLDRLAEAKEVAQLASVLGRSFRQELLAVVSQLAEPALVRALDKLVAAGLLFRRGLEPDITYEFKHALVQDAAYGSLLRANRQLFHERVASALNDQFPERVTSEPELLAYHYTRADLPERAIPAWQQAAEAAIQRSAMLEASSHLQQGLQLVERLPKDVHRDRLELSLQSSLGPTIRATMGPSTLEAGEAFGRAYTLSREIGETQNRFRILFGLFYYDWGGGRLDTARGHAEELMHLAELEPTDEHFLVANSALGVLMWNIGQNEAAKVHLEDAVAIYDPDVHGRLVSTYGSEFGVLTHRYLGYTSLSLGFPDQALQHAEYAVTLARTQHNPVSLCYALAGGCVTLKLRRDPEYTLRWADECKAIALEQGYPTWSTYAEMSRGWARAQLGQIDEGIAEFERGIQGFQSAGIDIWRPMLRALLAELYIMGGDSKEAVHLCTEELARVTGKGEQNQFESLLRITLGDALMAQSHRAAAEKSCEAAAELAAEQNARYWELRAGIRVARHWREQGKGREAHDLLSCIYNWFTEGFDTPDLEDAKALLQQLP